jgi:fluoride exporter
VIPFLLVCLGSAIGGGARYLVNLAAKDVRWLGEQFPHATLIVNLVGCFFICFVMTIAMTKTMSTNLRLFLTTGIMGGLTTYSSFDYETTRLLQTGASWSAALNVVSTVIGCFVAGLLGIVVARLFVE